MVIGNLSHFSYCVIVPLSLSFPVFTFSVFFSLTLTLSIHSNVPFIVFHPIYYFSCFLFSFLSDSLTLLSPSYLYQFLLSIYLSILFSLPVPISFLTLSTPFSLTHFLCSLALPNPFYISASLFLSLSVSYFDVLSSCKTLLICKVGRV